MWLITWFIKKKTWCYSFFFRLCNVTSPSTTIRLVRSWQMTRNVGWHKRMICIQIINFDFCAPFLFPLSFFPRLSSLQRTRYIRLEYKTKGTKQRTTSSNRIRLRLFIQIYTISIRNIRAIEQQFSSLLLSSLSTRDSPT